MVSSRSATPSVLAVLLAAASCPAEGFFVPGSQSFSAGHSVRRRTHDVASSPSTRAATPCAAAKRRGPLSLADGEHLSFRRERRPRGNCYHKLRRQRRAAPGALSASPSASTAATAPAETASSGNDDDAFAEELGVLDEAQAAMMAEQCILVDRNDRPTGCASKVETHLTSKGLLLHRAFSVFLFDKQGRVLMQRRADSKHTFAGYWTNTCCSHPLWNDVEMGTDMTTPEGDKSASEGDAAIAGATRAAVRKLGQELGIPADQLPLEDFSFLTKVHYIANSGSTWGEHEIDYVFLIQADVELDPNPNEVSDVEFMDKAGLRSLLAKAERGEVEFTPWSAYMIDKFVFGWWDHAGDKVKLASLRDNVIHRVGTCAEGEDD